MSVMDRFRDMGTMVMGKSESGVVRTGDKLLLMPNKNAVKVVNIYRDDNETAAARPGENLRMRISGARAWHAGPLGRHVLDFDYGAS